MFWAYRVGILRVRATTMGCFVWLSWKRWQLQDIRWALSLPLPNRTQRTGRALMYTAIVGVLLVSPGIVRDPIRCCKRSVMHGRCTRRGVQYVLLFGRPQYALVLVAWKAGLFARWLKYRHRIPYNIIEHWGLYISDNYVNTSIYLRILFKYIFSGAERTGAVSEPLARALFDNKITQKVPVVVPNVVHTDLYRIPPETENIPKSAVHEQDHVDPAPSDSRPLLMHVSNLAEVKNFSFVLDVFAAYRTRFPDARLWVAGAFNPMDAKARYDSNSANVEWFGFADQHTLLRHYQRATALIVASRHETFSIVTAEAIACGCPVLSTPLPALEAFKDWGTLCSLPAQHPDAWADVLEAWTKSRPKTKDHAWDGLHQAYGKKSVGNFISRWITDY